MLKDKCTLTLANQYVDQILEIDGELTRNDIIRAFQTGYDLGYISCELQDITKVFGKPHDYENEGDA